MYTRHQNIPRQSPPGRLPWMSTVSRSTQPSSRTDSIQSVHGTHAPIHPPEHKRPANHRIYQGGGCHQIITHARHKIATTPFPPPPASPVPIYPAIPAGDPVPGSVLPSVTQHPWEVAFARGPGCLGRLGWPLIRDIVKGGRVVCMYFCGLTTRVFICWPVWSGTG